MDVENRQQCQLMGELQHRPGPSIRIEPTFEQQKAILDRWQAQKNPDGVDFNPSRPGGHA